MTIIIDFVETLSLTYICNKKKEPQTQRHAFLSRIRLFVTTLYLVR